MPDLPELLVAEAGAWRTWLSGHHTQPDGVLLVLAKKGVTEPTSLTYDQALLEALCFGWIDGQVMRRDDVTYRQRFTPRRPRSPWSQRNVGLAEQLISQGAMDPAGLAEVERAKADGRWERAYAGSATMQAPDDLREAIAASPKAQAMWDVLTRTNRFSLIYRVQEAKRPETRARRIGQFVDMLERGETPHPQKAKPLG